MVYVLFIQHHGISPDQLEILTDTVTQMGEYTRTCIHLHFVSLYEVSIAM